MIILVGSEKGGTGKTTIAVNLAAMCALAGKETLLVDTDRQESATTWATTRAVTRGEGEVPQSPDIVCVAKTGKVGYDIDQLRSKFEIIIVDAGGRDSVELRQAMAVCDQMIIPVRPSQFDTWSLDKMASLARDVAERMGAKIEARVLLNATSTNPSVKEAEEVRGLLVTDYLDTFGVMINQVGDRIAFRRAARDGLCVAELSRNYSDPSAVDEMQRVYKEIFNENWSAATQKPNLALTKSARKA